MCSCFQLTQADSEDLSQPNDNVNLNTIIYSGGGFTLSLFKLYFVDFLHHYLATAVLRQECRKRFRGDIENWPGHRAAGVRHESGAEVTRT